MITLKKIRKEKKISQKNIAKLINTSQQAISRLEQGKSTINNIQLLKLCKYLNISADILLGLKNKQNNN